MRAGLMLFRWVVVAVVTLLTACASSVALHDNKKLVDTPYKLKSLQLAYQTPSWATDAPSVATTANGFWNFGPVVVKSAQTLIPAKGLELVSADVVRAGGSVAVSRKSSNDPTHAFAVLRIAPVKGEVRTGTTTRGGNYESSNLTASYEFKVELFDMASYKPVWQATLDANTRTGASKDNPRSTGGFYDDEMAQKLLELIVSRLKDDGLM